MVTIKTILPECSKHTATNYTTTSDARFPAPPDPELSKSTRFTGFPNVKYTTPLASKLPALPVTNS